MSYGVTYLLLSHVGAKAPKGVCTVVYQKQLFMGPVVHHSCTGPSLSLCVFSADFSFALQTSFVDCLVEQTHEELQAKEGTDVSFSGKSCL